MKLVMIHVKYNLTDYGKIKSLIESLNKNSFLDDICVKVNFEPDLICALTRNGLRVR